MDHFTSLDNGQPWWADVAHLRDDAPATSRAERAPRTAGQALAPAPGRDERRPPVRARSTRATAQRRGRRSERAGTDWFTDEALSAGRRTKPPVEPRRPQRPRATLVDVAPNHAVRRAQQVRRQPGERPTVTITGRPDAALPPQPRPSTAVRGRRTREHALSLVASPDRLILWAVALGLLMILASIGTASAGAAGTLTLLP